MVVGRHFDRGTGPIDPIYVFMQTNLVSSFIEKRRKETK
jgi:hypothetical protein